MMRIVYGNLSIFYDLVIVSIPINYRQPIKRLVFHLGMSISRQTIYCLNNVVSMNIERYFVRASRLNGSINDKIDMAHISISKISNSFVNYTLNILLSLALKIDAEQSYIFTCNQKQTKERRPVKYSCWLIIA